MNEEQARNGHGDAAPTAQESVSTKGPHAAPVPESQPVGRAARRVRDRLTRLTSISPVWSVVIFVGIVALRNRYRLVDPNLYAEDGAFFLREALIHGAQAFLTPFNGYLHIFPRLVAWIATQLPLEYAPEVFVLASLMGVGAVGWLLQLSFSRHFAASGPDGRWGQWAWPMAMLVVLALIPFAEEIWLNPSYMQWFLALTMPFWPGLVARGPRMGKAALALGLVWLALAGLSTPLGVFFIPIFVLYSLKYRQRLAMHLSTLVVLLAGVTQFVVYKSSSRSLELPGYSLGYAVKVVAKRIGSALFLGQWSGDDNLIVVGLALLLLALVLVGLRAWKKPELTLLCCYVGLTTLVSGLITGLGMYGESMMVQGNASRYLFIPQVTVCWLLLVSLSCSDAPPNRDAVTALLSGLVAMVLLSGLATSPVSAKQETWWHAYAPYMKRGVAMMVPTAPNGWFVSLPGTPLPEVNATHPLASVVLQRYAVANTVPSKYIYVHVCFSIEMPGCATHPCLPDEVSFVTSTFRSPAVPVPRHPGMYCGMVRLWSADAPRIAILATKEGDVFQSEWRHNAP